MKKKLIKIIGLAVIVIGLMIYGSFSFVHSGLACAWWGCDGSNLSTFISEQNAIDKNQQKLDTVEALPQMTDSLERKNLIKRALTFNNPNKISYIYLYSWSGNFIMYDTVKGKVSALDSSLTAQQQVVDSNGGQISGDNNCIQSNDNCYTLNAPAVDGSYGTNGQGIFYYNESGAYREWNGLYLLSDEPFTPQTAPNLVSQGK